MVFTIKQQVYFVSSKHFADLSDLKVRDSSADKDIRSYSRDFRLEGFNNKSLKYSIDYKDLQSWYFDKIGTFDKERDKFELGMPSRLNKNMLVRLSNYLQVPINKLPYGWRVAVMQDDRSI